MEKMKEHTDDLEKTLEINKSLVNQLVSSDIKNSEVFQQLTEENTYLKKRLKVVYQENGSL